jgi:hypothetical protein
MSYETTVRGKWLFDGAKDIGDMIDRCLDMANDLQEMRKAGIKLVGEIEDDYAHLETDDKAVAKKFEMWEVDDDE